MERKLAASFMLVAGLTGIAVYATRFLERALGAGAVFFALFMILLIASATALILARRLTERSDALLRAVRVIASGDLSVEVPRTARRGRPDEIDELADSFHQMRDFLLRVLAELQQTSDRIYLSASETAGHAASLSSLTGEIADAASRLSRGADTTVERIRNTSDATRRLASSAEKIGSDASAALKITRRAGEEARRGRRLARHADEELERIAAEVDRMSKVVAGFRSQAAAINRTVDLIATIAQQTHMVALNAAIEAARSGEHGSGFVVVAEEVRQLAERSAEFAEKISELAEGINDGTGLLITTMKENLQAAHDGREVIAGANESLRHVASSVLSMLDTMETIATLSHDQQDATKVLVGSIDEIALIADAGAESSAETSKATREQMRAMDTMTASAKDLASTADRLKDLFAVFRVPERP